MKIIQKLHKNVSDEFELAQKYYAILSDVNDLQLAKKEIQLIAFIAVRGNITEKNLREEFCRDYNTTVATINNMVSRLSKYENSRILIKDVKDKLTKVNPVIQLDFNSDIILQIELSHGS